MLPSAAASPTADATAVPVTPRELSVGPQRRRNVMSLTVLQLVAVPRVRVPPRRGAGRHVDPSLARELERLDYSAWLAAGEALASLTDKVIERGGTTTAAACADQASRQRRGAAMAFLHAVEEPSEESTKMPGTLRRAVTRGRARGGGRRHRGAAAYMKMNGWFRCRRGLRYMNGCAE